MRVASEVIADILVILEDKPKEKPMPKIVDRWTERACKKCGEVKPAEDFYRRSANSAGHKLRDTTCKACVLEAAKRRKAEKNAREQGDG